MEKTTSNYNTDCRNDKSDSKDVVDFIKTSNINNNNNNDNNSNNYNNNKLTLANATDNYYRKNGPCNDNNSAVKSTIRNSVATISISSKKKKSDESNEKKAIASTKERLSLFSFNKKFSQKHSNSTKSTVAAADAIKIANAKSDNTNTNSITNTTVPAPKKLATVATNLVEAGVGEKLALLPPESAASTARPHKFVKSSSIARFLGHTYHAKKFEKVASVVAAAATEEEGKQHRLSNDNKFHTYAGRRRRRLNEPYLERFRQCSKDDGDIANAEATLDLRDLCSGSRHDLHSLEHPEEGDRNVDFGTKAMRTISRGLGKLWWRRSNSVEISTPDPEYKVCYLGNVLTGWAKGEGCVEKQLNTLWRNYTQNTKPDVVMRIKVCASGLKATTRQHGLTEYWANRITHCCAPKNYPRVFCWIYRHEGRKLKHELRCHAVLCSKEKIVRDICSTLKENLECALREFKRDKILKQNARLSLANAAYDNPSLPRRKILLSVGGNNYRPPLERSKSAPKLMAIEEAIGEEDGDEVEETNEPEMKSCCQKDSLYPAMTLGRRRCRRGHSIRRTGKTRPVLCTHFADGGDCPEQIRRMDAVAATGSSNSTPSKDMAQRNAQCDTGAEEKRHSFDSDDSDDFEKLLKGHNYDSSNSLTNELLPYFDLQLHKQTSSSLGSLDDLKQDNEDGSEPLSLLPTINSNPSADPAAEYEFVDDSASKQFDAEPVGLRRDGVCSDGEEDYLDDDMCFRQASILNLLHRNSMRKMAQLALSSDESSIETNASPQYHHQGQSSISSNASSTLTSVSAADTAADSHPNSQHGSETRRKSEHGQSLDSDEGSISSGCETASTVTANQDDTSLRYRHSKQQPPLQRPTTADLQLHAEDEAPITVEDIYRRLESRLHGRHGSDATTFSSSSSMTLKMGSSPTPSLEGEVSAAVAASATSARCRKSRRSSAQFVGGVVGDGGASDSDCSDESGYVEYQASERSPRPMTVNESGAKPQLPPKPMTRRITGVGTTTMV